MLVDASIIEEKLSPAGLCDTLACDCIWPLCIYWHRIRYYTYTFFLAFAARRTARDVVVVVVVVFFFQGFRVYEIVLSELVEFEFDEIIRVFFPLLRDR